MAPSTGLALSDTRERILTRALQLVLLGILLFGIVTRNVGVAINAGVSLVITLLPALIRREISLRLDIGLVLWLTAAVLLHTMGILGPYRQVWWWDYLTHAFSASIIAGIGYAIVRSLDRYSRGIHLPEPFLTVFLFLLVVALGVIWEVIEFAVTKLGEARGSGAVLIVFGPKDIITDLVFTGLGGLLVVLWGRGYFRSLVHKLGHRLSGRTPE